MPYRPPTSTNYNRVMPDLLISCSMTREIKADLAPEPTNPIAKHVKLWPTCQVGFVYHLYHERLGWIPLRALR